MKNLFEITSIRSLTIRNRFIASATWMGLADADGSCTPRLIDHAVRLARGGVGLIISEFAFVSRGGQGVNNQLGVFSDELVPGLREMADAVHQEGCGIILQLVHAGLYAPSQLTGREPLARLPWKPARAWRAR